MRVPSLSPAPWHPTNLLLVLALWLGTMGNLPLWSTIWRLPETHGSGGVATLLALIVFVSAMCLSLLSLLIWPRWRRVGGLIVLAVSTTSSYFMHAYGVVIDHTMLANVVNTDLGEARDLMSGGLAIAIVLGVVLPGLWWWRQPVRPVGHGALILRQLGFALLGLIAATILLWSSFQDVASLMRNHKSLRYMINPFNTVSAVVHLSMGQAAQAQEPLQPIGADAVLAAQARPTGAPPLIVLVVGETARAADFQLGGYARDTTPELRYLQQHGDLVYFSNVTSCGTSTQTSVPCMFSHQGRADYDDSRHRYENLLDVLQHAGLAVLWIDNQSGCKGVCDRIPNARTRDQPRLCSDGECFDEAMLKLLPSKLGELDPARRARGTVVVLHQMGSHGPAYYKRSPVDRKPFQPECTSAALQDCIPEHIRNAYDNSIRYTDHFLAETVRWLESQPQPSALVYLSDHGESLGEKGLFLHGMPYRIAPAEQTQVPMAMWISESMQRTMGWRMDCLRDQSGKAWSHDNLFHTVLGLTQVTTSVAKPSQNILAPCM